MSWLVSPSGAALAIWLVGVIIAWLSLSGRQFLITAPLAFLLYQSFNVIGVAVESMRTVPFREDWPILVSLAFLSFVLGGVVANLLEGFKPAQEIKRWRDSPLDTTASTSMTWALVWFLVLLSLAVGFLYYRSVGYNTLFSQLGAIISGSQVDSATFSGLRSDAKSTYRAAGYAVQFIAIILPTLVVYLWLEGKIRRSAGLRVAAWGLLAASVYFVTVQGGRTYILALLLLLGLMVGHGSSPLPRKFRMSRGATIGIVVALGLSFALVTALQGRNMRDGREMSFAEAATVGVWDRVGGDYSRTQMVALKALQSEIPVNGDQWVEQLKIVLPGSQVEGMPFDVRVYYLIYGNPNGNNPLDPWGSYYYNFGTVGLLGIPFGMGFLAQIITIRGLIRSRRDVATVVIMSALGYRCMFLIDPYTILLAGPFTLWLLNRLYHVFVKKRPPESADPDAEPAELDHRGVPRRVPAGVQRAGSLRR
ncbi:MAG: hypothetical protein V9G04_13435 [Nocardioides sp.]|jgi:hypothetical protein